MLWRASPARWFWQASGQEVKTAAHLVGLYYRSVGRNANLLLNATPDPDGLIPEGDLPAYAQFGAEIRRRFGRPLGETSGLSIACTSLGGTMAFGLTADWDLVKDVDVLARGIERGFDELEAATRASKRTSPRPR